MFESWPEMWGGGYPAYRTTLRKFLWFRTATGGNAPEFKTVTGRIVQFLTKRIAPLKIEATLEPIQDLQGQEAPWPAGGGKNKLPPTTGKTQNKVTFTVATDGSVTVTTDGTASGNALLDIGRDVLTLPAGTYTASGTGTTQNVAFTIFKIVSGTASVLRNGVGSFTLTEETSVFFRMYVSSGTTASGTAYPMIESGSSATAFAPYSNECPISGHSGADIFVEDEYDAQADPTVQISFGSTVYGGTLTVNEDGTGSVVAKYANQDLGQLTWYYNSSLGGAPAFYTLANPTMKPPPNNNKKANIICSMFECVAANVLYVGTTLTSIISLNTGPNIQVRDNRYSDAEAFKTAMDGVQFVYELATPVTITLSPGQVNALLGNNTVWVDDSDNISVTYQSN